jgi:hypothetical protein
MEVLILSKTQYGATKVCVGGICISNKQFVRLLNRGGYYQPTDTPFNVGDIWDITFTVNQNRREPHNEDVTIHSSKFVKKIYLLETYIKNLGVPIWRNSILNIFEGKILWQNNGKGYFSENNSNLPPNSVGFWISDVDLNFSNGYYIYRNNTISKQLVYKGSQAPLPVIPRGTLVRLSLAKWFKPASIDEERCYLQLSGWYEDQVELNRIAELQSAIERYASKPALLQNKTPISIPKEKNTSGSCYIATLCYGDYYADEVCSFRDFRDVTLSKTKIGRFLIERYYMLAPKLTERLKNYKAINRLTKYLILNPLLVLIKVLNLDKE